MVVTSVQERGIATPEDTVSLAETYVSILRDEGRVDGPTAEAMAERVAELNMIGLAMVADEGEEADGLRSRLDEAADTAFELAGLDGVPGR